MIRRMLLTPTTSDPMKFLTSPWRWFAHHANAIFVLGLAVAVAAVVAIGIVVTTTNSLSKRNSTHVIVAADFVREIYRARSTIDELQLLEQHYFLLGEPRYLARMEKVRSQLATQVPRLEELSQGREYNIGSLPRLQERAPAEREAMLDFARTGHVAGTYSEWVLPQIHPDLEELAVLRERLNSGHDAAILAIAHHGAQQAKPHDFWIELLELVAFAATIIFLLALALILRSFATGRRTSAAQVLAPSPPHAPGVAFAIDAARADERARIGRDIHDELGALLMALKISLKRSSKFAEKARRSVDRQWPVMLDHVDVAMRVVSEFAGQLRPREVDHASFQSATETYVRRFAEITGIQCNLHIDAGSAPAEDDTASETFRVLQEILTNVARHAEATIVDIRIGAANGELKVLVTDNGKGVGADKLLDEKSHGVAGMFERARRMGGELHFAATAGYGTQVTLQLPLTSPP
jgi:signal transduction histidine kinase